MTIGIENKPWGAIDQCNQLDDYNEHLKNTFSDKYILIYLSRPGIGPSCESIDTEKRETLQTSGNFLHLDYVWIKSWLAECAQECKAARFRYFLEDFVEYVRQQFEGGVSVLKEEIVVSAATQAQNVSSAAAIAMAWPKIANSLVKKLAELLTEHDLIKGKGIVSEVDFDWYKKWTGIRFRHDNWKNYFYCFACEDKNARQWSFGIETKKEGVLSIENLVQKHSACTFGKGKKSSNWPWYMEMKNPPYWDWSISDEVWAGIQPGGATVEEFARILASLVDIFKEDVDAAEAKLKQFPAQIVQI